jgi:carboxypeptidase Taq
LSETPYQRLEHRFRRLDAIWGAEAMLSWDWASMMPPGGTASRSEQMATLKTLGHEILAGAETKDLIDAAIDDADLDSLKRANLFEMDRLWLRASALDKDLVSALSMAASTCEAAWRKGRKDDDFAAVLPSLESLLSLVREQAKVLGEHLGLSSYDALLDAYEADGRSQDIDILFERLEAFLPNFLAEVVERQKKEPDVLIPTGPFSADSQRKLGLEFMKHLGFDFEHGRLDESLHPFCGGTPDDVRITTRYDENDFTSGLMAILHETGHALYEQGLPEEWRGQPAGTARSMSLHESQSLLVEMQVCRAPAFLAFASPIIAKAFDAKDPAWTPNNLARLYTRTKPGFIRVDADEVTYPLHVILRYRLEKAMIGETMEARHLPEAWNEGMQDLLGLSPKTDREGCLQDIHWYGGDWGYFPTYTLGALSAAQLFDAARKSDGAIDNSIAKGDFAPLLSWLGANVHSKASLLSTQEIMIKASGKPLDADAFIAHLKRRYFDDSPLG